MHTASIDSLATDNQNRYLVSGSQDKTVRVWSVDSGRLLRVLRPPAGPGEQGKVYAVAISPDGSQIACGGAMGEPNKPKVIYLFDRESGAIVKRFGTDLHGATNLTFSADGRYLAESVWTEGVRVFRVADGVTVLSDNDYSDLVYSVDFDRAGRLIAGSWDGFLRLYDANFKLLAKVPGHGGKHIFNVRFSPDAQEAAVGYSDSNLIDIYATDANEFVYSFSPDTSDVGPGNMGAVAWAPSGRWLYAGGTCTRDKERIIRRWHDAGHGEYDDWMPGAHNTIEELLGLHDGDLAWASFDPALGIVDGNGARVHLKQPNISDFRGSADRFRVSRDGDIVQFAYDMGGESPAYFSLDHREITPGICDNPPLFPTSTETQGLKVTNWRFSSGPKANGVLLKLDPHERTCSAAIAPDRTRFVIGSDTQLRCFNTSATELWRIPIPSVAWSLTVGGRAADDSSTLAIAALGDGTIRWYRLSDGKELLALLPMADRQRWVAWTPSGYYDCSEDGESLFGFQIGHGPDKAATFAPAAHFRATYNRPDVVARILRTLDEGAALREADAAAASTAAAAPPPLGRVR